MTLICGQSSEHSKCWALTTFGEPMDKSPGSFSRVLTGK
jgi:hypothetical protein